jgi:hypothetical protein
MQVISSVVQRMHRTRVSYVIPRTLQNLVSYVSGLSILNIHVQKARSRALKSWWVYTLRASASRNRCKYEATLETMTADIITRYESELTAVSSFCFL